MFNAYLTEFFINLLTFDQIFCFLAVFCSGWVVKRTHSHFYPLILPIHFLTSYKDRISQLAHRHSSTAAYELSCHVKKTSAIRTASVAFLWLLWKWFNLDRTNFRTMIQTSTILPLTAFKRHSCQYNNEVISVRLKHLWIP